MEASKNAFARQNSSERLAEDSDKVLTATRRVFWGLPIRTVRFEIAAKWWRFESLRSANHDSRHLSQRRTKIGLPGNLSFRISEAEFPDNFGHLWAVSDFQCCGPQHYSGRTPSFSFAIFWTKSGNSETRPQKFNSETQLRNWFSEFLSQTFQVSDSDFPSFRMWGVAVP